MPLTYASYLKLDELLRLQEPRSTPAEHDEMLFIVIHQTYELWFKLLLHETDKVIRDFQSNDLFGAIATWKRMRTIMKTLVGQLDILETMTPLSFASFRDRLDTASGFQSYQFREIEFVFGYIRGNATSAIPDSEGGKAKAHARIGHPTVIDAFYRFLQQRGAKVPADLLERNMQERVQPNEALQDEVFRLYKQQPELVILFELMTDFDEGMQEWRYRHVKLVERTIGAKKGTGGSAGLEFLKQSLFTPLFPISGPCGIGCNAPMLYDITPTVSPRLGVWPGDTPPSRRVLLDMDAGANITLSTLKATVHLGAHADAPSHYGLGAPDIAAAQLDRYLGPCQVVRARARRGERVMLADLDDAITESRLLIATGTFPNPEAWNTDFAGLAPELVDHLADRGVRLIGVDTPSVDLFDSKDLPAHRRCLARDVWIVEGLMLGAVPPDRYELIALPLKLEGFDASPVRAVLRR